MSEEPTGPAEQAAPDWKADFRRSARRLAVGLWAGLIAGFVIGGIGSRLAMFILRLTSDPSLSGVETDDGFIIGRISGDSFFLIIFGTAAGVLGGVIYLIVRGWIPGRYRGAAMALLGGSVAGAAIIKPHGIDFNALDPLSLAIAMFIAVPALYGWAMSWLAEKFLAGPEGGRSYGWVAALLPLLVVGALGPLGLIVLAASVLLWALNRKFPLVKVWYSPAIAWLGRAGLMAWIVAALVALTRDTVAIL